MMSMAEFKEVKMKHSVSGDELWMLVAGKKGVTLEQFRWLYIVSKEKSSVVEWAVGVL